MSVILSSNTSYIIPQEVLDKIGTVLDGDELVQVLFFLVDMGDKAVNYVRILNSVINSDVNFRSCVQRLSQDATKLTDDPIYDEIMTDIGNNYLKSNVITNGSSSPVESGQDVNFNQILTDSGRQKSETTFSFLSLLSKLPKLSQKKAIETTTAVAAKSPSTALTIRGTTGNIKPTSVNKLVNGLAAVYMACDVYLSIRQWWKGEISGKRCIKKVIDGLVSVACGIGGGVAGAALGSLVLPGVGTVVGGLNGGVAAAELGSYFSDWTTKKLFGLHQNEALENVYRSLGLNCTKSSIPSNGEINESFRRLALQHHPDKGGDVKEWHKLQCAMAVIKASKEE